MRSERDIAAKRIVVTGATGGIGKEIARALISRGALLTLIARNADRAAATAAELAAEPGAAEAPEIVMCDLADLSSVRAAAHELHERYDGIDVLIANAGMRSFESHTTTDGFEQMMATNHLGPFLLTNLLLDLLRARTPSRIVITASEAHRLGGRVDLDHLAEPAQFSARASEGFYGRSKLMNVLFTQELARRIEGSGVTANCFCPGAVATGLVRDSRFLTLAAGTLSRTPLIRQPDQGARMGIRLVVDPALADVSGSFFTSTPGLRFLPRTAARKDIDYQRRAWDRSAEAVGL